MLIDKIKATVANKVAVLKDINGNKIIPMTLTKAVQDDNGKKLNNIIDDINTNIGKIDKNMGDISALQTVDKTSLVSAINELKKTGGGGGSTLNVFKSTGGTWGEYVANTQTNTFTVEGYNGTEKTIDLYYESVLLIPDKHFNISKTGDVTLAFELEVGESIDYCISDVSFDFNELANKPDFNGLSAKVDILNTDRGYLNTKILPNDTDVNTVTTNGNYWVNAWVHTNMPPVQADGIRINGVMNVYQADNVVYQFVHGNDNKGKWYRERLRDGSWTSWQQIATTDKLTPRNDSNFDTFVANSFNVFSRYGISNSKFPSTSEMLLNGISISRTNTDDTLLLGANMYSHGYGRKMVYKIGNDDWQQIATTTKMPFSLTAGAGYTIISQNCYIMNGQTFINLSIKKTDETAFTTGNLYVAYSNILPSDTVPLDTFGYQTASLSMPAPVSIPSLLVGKNILISNSVAGVKSIIISGVI